ncbi:hypothetical protein LB452_08505 [Psychroflexus sp. CAK8W]|uniref:PH domain-containing protein n=1 Tax=Psychroflexus longus TaxID=2873596 RepID=A0ABS7XJ13_9FLAO|nr:hypothetical protein [Psychroflexus longus]MBZ9778962.1 hypothetical protein [Psychroflexus longus]
MKINFYKKRIYSPLIIASLWIIVGFYFLFTGEDSFNWSAFVYLFLGAGHLFDFFYSSKNLYLLIENNSIEEVKLLRSNTKIDFNEIQDIQKIEGNYIVKSETKTIQIDFNSIDNTSLVKLIKVFKTLDLPSEKNCFSKF